MHILAILLSVYFVQFADKPASDTPCLSPRALEQRQKWNIALDELDYPVSSVYLDSLRASGATIHHASRWMNGATCTMSASLADSVASWSFVREVEMTRGTSHSGGSSAPRHAPKAMDAVAEAALESDRQLALYNLHPLHQAGYRGQGIIITICDGGFTACDTASFVRQDHHLGHFDLTDDSYDFFGSSGTHGLACLSCISGTTANFEGAATEADYYLMRSEEEDTESPKEMDNLVVALETADSLGTNIFSVSLGYSWFDNTDWTLPHSALDGRTTRASRAATIAARKGILVCAAAGNEGDKAWQKIVAPADADSILTVGSVNVDSLIASTSSYGPSADGRIKPDVCAVGQQATLLGTNGQPRHSNGTSFATPLMAGLAACLWSALPDENAMQIRERIIRSANRYDNPDPVRYGYGIPDAYAAWQGITTCVESPVETTAIKVIRDGQLFILKGGETYTIYGTRL